MAIEVSPQKSHRIRRPSHPKEAPATNLPTLAFPAPRKLQYKAWFDRLVALVLLVPGLPLMLLLALLVRLGSPGPGIYRQTRMGRQGRSFTMYKLRTMTQDAEAQTGAVWATRRDPRITKVGWLLRRFHLDELPQLFNVLKGEMSLVGPRPERPEIVARLVDQVPNYLDRLAVPPGVTGLAQINLPPDTVVDDVRRKLVLDREYVECAGLGLDLRILLCTFARVCGIPNRWPRRLLGLEYKLPPGVEPPSVIVDLGIVRAAPVLAAVREE
jgi:lipopolysaccharide/colanic/teichoic acid biosynthesis glycosyltransferase